MERLTPTCIFQSYILAFSDSTSLTLVCPQIPDSERSHLSYPDNPNHSLLASSGDLDAIVELFGHVRAEDPNMSVHMTTRHTFIQMTCLDM